VRLDTDPYLERYAARVRGMSASEIRALFAVASRPEVVSFAGGMPDTSVLDLAAVEAVVAAVIREDGATALQYGGGQGREQLRELLVEVMHHEGVPGHTDDLVVTVGGQQALELVAKCFVDPGDIVLAEGPTYVGGLGALASHQADVRHVPMDADGMQIDLLEDVLDQLEAEGRRPTFVYTIPNHQNPAGVSLSVERRHRLAELAETRDLLLVEDNPYGLLDFDGKTFPSLRSLVPDRVVYVGTMSKTFAPGVRTGWVAAPRPIRDKLVLLREAGDLCPSNLTQMIVERWLATQPWREQVERFQAVYRTKAHTMLAALEAGDARRGALDRPDGRVLRLADRPARHRHLGPAREGDQPARRLRPGPRVLRRRPAATRPGCASATPRWPASRRASSGSGSCCTRSSTSSARCSATTRRRSGRAHRAATGLGG
jgi:2-aminoadipate transaminase